MRRKLIIVSALPASFILGICAQIVSLSSTVSDRYEPKSVQGMVSQDYEFTGYYYVIDEFPWALDNIQRIDLTTADFHVNSDSSVSRTPITPKGYLVTDYDVYKLSSVNIDGGRLSFTTEPHAGVSYQFTGTLLEGNYTIHGYVVRTIMLDGRIDKMLFGFKVSESEVRFTKGSGC